MPVHDWSRVGDGTFHDFHYSWVLEIKRALKGGILPAGYYVMAEQIGGDIGTPDVLTLQSSGTNSDEGRGLSGTSTLAESPPVVHAHTRIERPTYPRLQRTLVVRHSSGDNIVAMIEVMSRGNTSSRDAIRQFLNKILAALDAGIHLLLVDVHPLSPRHPNGIHGAVLHEIGTEEYVLDRERPLTAVAYVGGRGVDAFVTHFGIGDALPTMPLFLTRENYVHVPLESTYLAAFEDVPPRFQDELRAANGVP